MGRFSGASTCKYWTSPIQCEAVVGVSAVLPRPSYLHLGGLLRIRFEDLSTWALPSFVFSLLVKSNSDSKPCRPAGALHGADGVAQSSGRNYLLEWRDERERGEAEERLRRVGEGWRPDLRDGVVVVQPCKKMEERRRGGVDEWRSWGVED